MPHVIVDQVRGSRLCPAALLADATYLNAAIYVFHDCPAWRRLG
jgi:hypothetical protein